MFGKYGRETKRSDRCRMVYGGFSVYFYYAGWKLLPRFLYAGGFLRSALGWTDRTGNFRISGEQEVFFGRGGRCMPGIYSDDVQASETTADKRITNGLQFSLHRGRDYDIIPLMPKWRNGRRGGFKIRCP